MSSIRVLKNFIEVTRHPSVAAAAREIGLTPAAAGQQLAQLEEDLGIQLFDRNKRSLVLNNQGRAMIQDRKSTRLNSSHVSESRMPSSA